MRRVKVRAGDVFQILTSKGGCYGQATHKHPKWKFVVAVFRRFFDLLSFDLSAVDAEEPQIVTRFVIEDAVQQACSPSLAMYQWQS